MATIVSEGERVETNFEPLAVTARFGAPRRGIDPDRSKSWLRRMAPIVLSHKWLIGSALLGSIVTMLIQIAIPRIMMEAIDSVLIKPPGARAALGPFVWAIAILAVVRGLLGYVFRYFLQRTSLLIEYDLRNLLYEHFTRLSFSFFDVQQTGQLISRANSDIRAVQMFLAFAPFMLITVLTFIVAFILMCTIHIPLAIVSVLVLPGVYVSGMRMRKKMFPVSWIVQGRTADVATIVEENVTGVRVVKSFAGEEQQIGLLSRAAERLRWASVKQVDMRAEFQPLMQNIPRIGLALVLVYGGWLAMNRQITIGSLVLFNAYVLMLQMPFMMLGFLLMMANRAAAASGRIFEILDAKPEIVDAVGAAHLSECLGEVCFRDVVFGYGKGSAVLDGFHLRMRPGETVAMVGRTGCGKSTAARLLPRFYDVREGAILIDGRDVRDITLVSLRSHIGLVLDEPFLFSESVRANITYGRPEAPLDDVITAAKAAGAHEFIVKLENGYDTVIGERGYTLSGGQRQRIAIARTLLVNPRILILDDATSAVDVQVEQEIHEALQTLMVGRTTLIIAHRLSTISLADRVVLVDGGKIVAEGTHVELMRDVPLYAEVLAHAEEEWQAAHKPPPDFMEMLPPRMRTMIRMMREREASGSGMMGGGVPGMSPVAGGGA